jgi:hypothetical protein
MMPGIVWRDGMKNTKKSTPHGTMRIVDLDHGKMQCRVCGSVHWVNTGGSDPLPRGSYQCPNRCQYTGVDSGAAATA